MKDTIQEIQPYEADGIIYHADKCLPLVDAAQRKKINARMLSRHTYPGERLDQNTMGLNSIGYWDAHETQDWGLDWHRNEGIEFHFLESGSMPYAQQNKQVVLQPGNLTITRPWEAHKVGDPYVGIGKFYWVILDMGVRRPHQDWKWPDWITLTPGDLDRLTTILRLNDQSIIMSDKEVANCFINLGKAIDQDRSGSSASRIRVLINQLLLLLLEMLNQEDIELNESLTDSSRSVKLFLKELDNSLAKNWTIEEMSQSAGVGITRFTHHCKQLTNLTPIRYLMFKRLELSKQLLIAQEEMSISKIAYTCGFTTSQYFASVFKKSEKCTPKEYRVKYLATLEQSLELS
ncbi:MAG: AraC family transcriptional regulator [Cytophagales bacterium]|nr:AraC family transcriptional regulator [Cytophagales bacterium]